VTLGRGDAGTGRHGDAETRGTGTANIRHFRELDVYQMAMDLAVEIFELTKGFPAEERYSLTDQVRRSSPSV
jgi:23S rRNA-intervening sequence protein